MQSSRSAYESVNQISKLNFCFNQNLVNKLPQTEDFPLSNLLKQQIVVYDDNLMHDIIFYINLAFQKNKDKHIFDILIQILKRVYESYGNLKSFEFFEQNEKLIQSLITYLLKVYSQTENQEVKQNINEILWMFLKIGHTISIQNLKPNFILQQMEQDYFIENYFINLFKHVINNKEFSYQMKSIICLLQNCQNTHYFKQLVKNDIFKEVFEKAYNKIFKIIMKQNDQLEIIIFLCVFTTIPYFVQCISKDQKKLTQNIFDLIFKIQNLQSTLHQKYFIQTFQNIIINIQPIIKDILQIPIKTYINMNKLPLIMGQQQDFYIIFIINYVKNNGNNQNMLQLLRLIFANCTEIIDATSQYLLQLLTTFSSVDYFSVYGFNDFQYYTAILNEFIYFKGQGFCMQYG